MLKRSLVHSFLVVRLSTCSKSFPRPYSQSSVAETFGLSIYSTLTKRKEALKLKNSNVLYWYSCGPTVYDSAHIGHACSYVNLDIIRRILVKHFRVNVVNLMNITDIDDKIIQRALKVRQAL